MPPLDMMPPFPEPPAPAPVASSSSVGVDWPPQLAAPPAKTTPDAIAASSRRCKGD
jgi:hypothetical protein